MSELGFVTREEALASGKAALYSYNRFRNGTVIDLSEVSTALSEAGALLSEIAMEDDSAFHEGLAAMPGYQTLATTLDGILAVFDLTKPDASEDKFKQDYRTVADIIHQFSNSELDPLRKQVGTMVVWDEEVKDATLDERGVRELVSLMASSVDLRVQRAKVCSAAAVISALLSGDQVALATAAITEVNTLVRLRTAAKYNLFLGSLAGVEPKFWTRGQ